MGKGGVAGALLLEKDNQMSMIHYSRLVAPACALALGLLVAGCDTSLSAAGPGGNNNNNNGSDGGGNNGSGDLPCDVYMLLQNRCVSCHGSPTVGGAPMSLLSKADLTATSFTDPAKTFVDRSVIRMMDTKSPMPPAPASAATAAEIKILTDWIAAGTPAGSCGGGGDGGVVTSDPLNAAPTCTSGQTAPALEFLKEMMGPGEACISCHQQRHEGPQLVGGTVYPTGHEPNDCVGGSAGITPSITTAQVILIGSDTNKTQFPMTVNANGNFYLSLRRGATPPKFPYTAKVVWNGKERVMSTAQTNGDCNSCHTAVGLMMAPGRVTLPAP